MEKLLNVKGGNTLGSAMVVANAQTYSRFPASTESIWLPVGVAWPESAPTTPTLDLRFYLIRVDFWEPAT